MPAISINADNARTLRLVSKAERDEVVTALDAGALAENFAAKPGEIVLLPAGSEVGALYGIGDGKSEFAMGGASLGFLSTNTLNVVITFLDLWTISPAR